MHMIINNLLSIPIYEFRCNEQLTEEIFNQAITSKFTDNLSNKILEHDHFYHDELFDWFDQCIEQIKKIYFLDEISLPIVSSWINKSSKLERHHTHRHFSSIISGIFYLTSHDKAETVFYYENPYFKMGKTDIFLASKYLKKSLEEQPFTITGKIKPEKGKLILFPSSMRHGTRPNIDSYDRYSISFNTFFSGTLQDKEIGRSSDIILNPLTVRQTLKN